MNDAIFVFTLFGVGFTLIFLWASFTKSGKKFFN